MTVHVKQDPSIETSVKSNGTFTLKGIPSGAVTLVFRIDGRVISAITLRDVRRNQEIRIVVELTDDLRVVLVSQDRDQVSLGGCARSPGFWCQNQNGKNPNLTAAHFEELAEDAAGRVDVAALDSADKIRNAVCDTSDQLLRHLAVLALNLAAELVSEDTELQGEDFATVGLALKRAMTVANDSNASRSDRNEIKDVLDRINNKRNTVSACTPDDDSRDDDSRDDDDPPANANCNNLQIPAGALPPPGECKLWDPQKPAGQQGPPGSCNQHVPPGLCLIDHDGRVVG